VGDVASASLQRADGARESTFLEVTSGEPEPEPDDDCGDGGTSDRSEQRGLGLVKISENAIVDVAWVDLFFVRHPQMDRLLLHIFDFADGFIFDFFDIWMPEAMCL
jgi:hypothetical protein